MHTVTTVKLKAHSHEHEITNEISNDHRDVGLPRCSKRSRLTFCPDQKLLDPNDNVWDTSGSQLPLAPNKLTLLVYYDSFLCLLLIDKK